MRRASCSKDRFRGRGISVTLGVTNTGMLLFVVLIFFFPIMRQEDRRDRAGGKAGSVTVEASSYRDRRPNVCFREKVKRARLKKNIENTRVLTAILVCHHLSLVNSLIREVNRSAGHRPRFGPPKSRKHQSADTNGTLRVRVRWAHAPFAMQRHG